MNGENLVPNELLVSSFPLKGAAAGAGLPGTVVTITDATQKDLCESTTGKTAYLSGLRLVWTVVGAAAGEIQILNDVGDLVATVVVGEAAPAVGKTVDISFKVPRTSSTNFQVKGYVNVGTVKITVDGFYR